MRATLPRYNAYKDFFSCSLLFWRSSFMTKYYSWYKWIMKSWYVYNTCSIFNLFDILLHYNAWMYMLSVIFYQAIVLRRCYRYWRSCKKQHTYKSKLMGNLWMSGSRNSSGGVTYAWQIFLWLLSWDDGIVYKCLTH